MSELRRANDDLERELSRRTPRCGEALTALRRAEQNRVGAMNHLTGSGVPVDSRHEAAVRLERETRRLFEQLLPRFESRCIR